MKICVSEVERFEAAWMDIASIFADTTPGEIRIFSAVLSTLLAAWFGYIVRSKLQSRKLREEARLDRFKQLQSFVSEIFIICHGAHPAFDVERWVKIG